MLSLLEFPNKKNFFSIIKSDCNSDAGFSFPDLKIGGVGIIVYLLGPAGRPTGHIWKCALKGALTEPNVLVVSL